jgi:hypothetical protein
LPIKTPRAARSQLRRVRQSTSELGVGRIAEFRWSLVSDNFNKREEDFTI